MKKLIKLLSGSMLALGSVCGVVGCSSSNAATAINPSSSAKPASNIGPAIHTGPDSPTDVIKKIKNKDVAVPPGTNTSTIDRNTERTIKLALQQANPGLTSDDLNELSLAPKTLVPDQAITDKVTASLGQQSASTNIQITLQSKSTSASAIIKKITNKTNLPVPFGTNSWTGLAATVTVLKNVLQQANPALTSDDMTHISFQKKELSIGEATSVTTTASFGPNDTDSTTVTFVLAKQPNPLNELLRKITNTKFSVPLNTNPDTSNPSTITVLKSSLKSANPSLTSADLQDISFSKTTLKSVYVPVTLYAVVDGQQGKKGLQIKLAAQSTGILDNIKNTDYTLSYLTDPKLSDAATVQAIKEAIRYNNQDSFNPSQNINEQELSLLSISGADTLSTSAPTTLKVTASGEPGKTVSIQVTINTHKTYDHHIAPFVDMGELAQNQNASSLQEIQKNTGLKNFMLAFVQNDITGAAGKINPAWFGTVPVFDPQSAAAKASLSNIDTQINTIEGNGGHVGISFGGAAGSAIWASNASYTPSADDIAAALTKVIQKYKLNWIDFDIEGSELSDDVGLTSLGKALGTLQTSMPKLQVSLTVAADAAGSIGINPNFKKPFTDLGNGLARMPIINSMAMDYGSGWGTKSMYDGAVKAVTEVANTTSTLWAQSKFGKSGQQVLTKYTGVTPMLGNNDSSPQCFTKHDASQLGAWATKNTIRWIGYWDANSDFAAPAPAPGKVTLDDSGMYQQPYDYAHIFQNTFGDSDNKSGQVSGTINITAFQNSPNVLAFTWNAIENAAYYSIYVDDKIQQSHWYGGNGYFGFSPTAYTPGAHKIKVVAHGSGGSSVTSSEFSVTIPDSSAAYGVNKQLNIFNTNTTYSAPNTLIVGTVDGKVNVYETKWWLNPGQTLPELVKSKAVSLVASIDQLVAANVITAAAGQDFKNGTLPGWYPQF